MTSQSFIATKVEHRPHSFSAFTQHPSGQTTNEIWDDFEINESAERLNNKLNKTGGGVQQQTQPQNRQKLPASRTASNGSTKSLPETKRKTIVTDLELL